MGGFLPPRHSHSSTWAACPASLLLVAAVRVQFPSHSSLCMPAGATELRRALCPSLHPSGGKYSPPLPCRQPGTPVRVSHRDSGGEKKIPPSHRNHQFFQQRKCLHHVWAAPLPARGVSTLPATSLQQAHPGLRGGLRLLQN